MRPMHMQYPKDRNCAYLDQQYMLGDRILVAPVFSSDGKQDFYLPEGKLGTSSYQKNLHRETSGIPEPLITSVCHCM